VKIPTKRFRELHMGATEKDFLHHFSKALQERGFRLGPGTWVRAITDGKIEYRSEVRPFGSELIPDPPLTYDRSSAEFLVVSQVVPGQLHSQDRRLIGFLQLVAVGSSDAVARLYGFLLSEGDNRAETLRNLSVDVPEDVLMTPDSGEGRGKRMEAPGDDLVQSAQIADKLLRRKILVLFGAMEEPI
jgi:hypothetical protein